MSDPTPGEQVWNLLRGAMMTKTVGIVNELGVADALADGPRAVADVAREVGANADSLHRFLRALASDGVFEEHAPGVFGNTPASELLQRENGWHDFAHLFGSTWYTAVGDMEAVTGRATFPATFGAEFWTWLADHPDERAAFDRAMEQGKERRIERLAALDWRGDETVVDVGGGNGSLLLELLRHRPTLRGIVFDLPETNRDESTFGDRCTFVEGSFFERVPEGDVYLLSTILHDWDDEHAARILRTIAVAATPATRLLIIDAVITPGNSPSGSKWLDLLMLVLAGGRERDESQWRTLLEGAGFEPVSIEDGLIEARCTG
jgi:O-methyltransferase/methyltransferase family protein